MDTGKGSFDMMNEPEAERLKALFPRVADRIFKVGEMVHIKDSFFRIKSIKPDELRLKLLSNEQSAAARKAEKDAEAHGKALDFVNRAEVAEEQTLLRMLASKDKLAAYEMLKSLQAQYHERLARIGEKLLDLELDLEGDEFAPVEEAVDAMVAEEEDPWGDQQEIQEEMQALGEIQIQEAADAAEDDWPMLTEDSEVPCLRHDFSEGRRECRVCGMSFLQFRDQEAAAEEALAQMRNELLGKGEP